MTVRPALLRCSAMRLPTSVPADPASLPIFPPQVARRPATRNQLYGQHPGAEGSLDPVRPWPSPRGDATRLNLGLTNGGLRPLVCLHAGLSALPRLPAVAQSRGRSLDG